MRSWCKLSSSVSMVAKLAVVMVTDLVRRMAVSWWCLLPSGWLFCACHLQNPFRLSPAFWVISGPSWQPNNQGYCVVLDHIINLSTDRLK